MTPTHFRTPVRHVAGWLRSFPIAFYTHPFEMLLALMCVSAGMSVAIGRQPAPDSIEAALPTWLVICWQTMLLIGGTSVFVGLLRPRWKAERFGLTLLGPAAAVYALAIITQVGWGGIYAAAITLGFALACFARLYTLVIADRIIRAALR